MLAQPMVENTSITSIHTLTVNDLLMIRFPTIDSQVQVIMTKRTISVCESGILLSGFY
jgi:hypothetical protein